MNWTPQSWRDLPIRQQPDYDDPAAVEAALSTVRGLPPLVHHGEVDRLKRQLAEAGQGRRFVLQGGDCAERFVDCAKEPIEAKLKILLQMSVVLTWGGHTPVVRVARMAGQFAKPRSRPTEVVEGYGEIHSYRGDHVNGFDPSDRVPDPSRMVRAYTHSAATLNYVRALIDGGFADLASADHWDLGFLRDPALRDQYEAMLARIRESIDFMEACGAGAVAALRSVDFFTSHEGLLLPYEEANTFRIGPDHYNLGAHFVWIGDRTRNLDGAHIEYFRGIRNPIGLKCGPSLGGDELVELCGVLNPENEPGRLTLISRHGAGKVGDKLPEHIEAVQRAGSVVTWSTDPMHGNTRSTANGLKTRDFDNILAELREGFDIHKRMGSVLGGVHFELTGEDVTECAGGPQGLEDAQLSRAYETFCDPRLNDAQSLHLAFLIARRLERRRKG
jgi:3-deoxy-7-phosphoheptulonate synthase